MSAPRDEPNDDDFAMGARESLAEEGTRATDAIEELESQIREQLDHALDPEPKEDNTETYEEVIEPENLAESRRASAAVEENVPKDVDETAAEDTSLLSAHDNPEASILSVEQEETSILSGGADEASTFSAPNDPEEVIMQSIEDDSQFEHEDDQHNDTSLLTDEHQDTQSQLQTPEPTSRRESQQSATSIGSSPRRGSVRTEALIQAAARNIVAQIEQGEEVESVTEEDPSFLSETETVERSRVSDAYSMDESLRSSANAIEETGHGAEETEDGVEDHVEADDENTEVEQVRSGDEGADSSSHHENEDDVFSEHSPRSSVGSASDAAPSDADVRKMDDNVTRRSRTRSPRMSGVSGFSQYEDDEDDFIPTIRGTPRPAFRSPSSVKAMQMTSPPASVFGSPRSSRRTPLPTVSRLGSPGVSAQYSPKKKTPRFKRNTPPLVLLHVTLLPLRWLWGDVLNDAEEGDLSTDGKNLRDAWSQLQDRMGDTTCERGILLPHPQNDYEVLEERLLEALELPLRRRARILECGHYLGPANEMDMLDDMDSDEEYDDEDANVVVHSLNDKTHWCTTCRSDIRYDSLGAGKVFRVKVYASNGLMKAGAWDTCWKEMERVDVEIEPLVELSTQHELARLQTEQERKLDQEHALELRRSLAQEEEYGLPEDEHEEVPAMEEEPSYLEEQAQPEPTPQPHVESDIPPASPGEARRLRDEERFREIYGHTPSATHPEPDSPDPPFSAHASPPSPSVEAFERRQERARTAQPLKSASLPELLFESVRVLLQDRKNVVILVMGLLVAMLALRGGGRDAGMDAAMDIERLVERRKAVVVPPQDTHTAVLEETIAVIEEAVQASVAPVESATVEDPEQAATDPCSSSQGEAPSASTEVVRVVETVTETAVETATVTQTFTAVETESFADAVPEESSIPAQDSVNKAFEEIAEHVVEEQNSEPDAEAPVETVLEELEEEDTREL